MVVACVVSLVWLREEPAKKKEQCVAMPGHVNTTVCSVGSWRVYQISSFFPEHVATRWRQQLDERRHAGTWLYASNDGGNAKVLSAPAQAATRRAGARARAKAGGFAYAKFELARDDALALEMRHYMTTPEVRARVSSVLGAPALRDELADFFVTLYTDGDFLSTHEDAFSGTFAFVAYVGMGQWHPSHGGRLRFTAPSSGTPLLQVEPGNNDLVLFRTRNPRGPPHDVEEATGDGYLRYGFTGWFSEVSDEMTEAEKRELQRMRGNTVL